MEVKTFIEKKKANKHVVLEIFKVESKKNIY